MKKNNAILIFIALCSLVILLFLSQNIVSPYVPFTEAREQGKPVQIMGFPDRNLKPVIDQTDCLLMELKDYHDRKETLLIQYCNSIPENINHAESIVAHGTFNRKTGIFIAERLYYKCPSKYQK